MEYRKITAIMPEAALEKVEEALRALMVPGMTITKVQGYGAYKNFFRPDLLACCARVELFIEAEKVDETVATIREAVTSNLDCNAIVAVLPVEAFHKF